MLILGQNGDVMVNMERIHSLTTHYLGYYSGERKQRVNEGFRVLAWYGEYGDACFGIGDYATEDRAKEIIRQIFEKYGEYLHRQGGPAILRGSVDVPEAFWVLPKIFEMPKE